MAPDRVPTTELGVIREGNLLPASLGTYGSSLLTPLDESETNAAWLFPQSVWTADAMRTDVKIDALLDGLLRPIRQWRWAITPGKATLASAKRVAEDLGLPVVGEEGSDTIVEANGRFSHDDHLRHALLALIYGFYDFEIKGELRDGFARLVKLAPRPPRTIMNVSVAEDGGLEWIQQHGYEPPRIPVSRLVVFVWEKEGANWFGRSILRSCYGPWIARDRLIRDDLTKHRRNATGMPILEMDADPTDAQKKAGEDIVNNYRSADKGGGLLPAGWKLHLQGVEGGTSDPIGSVKYHDSLLSQRFQQMVADLGITSSGNRALGDTFEGLLLKAQESIACWYRDVMQQHVIEDFTRWNDGPGADAPKLVYDAYPEAKLADIEAAVKDGVVQMDDQVENVVRSRLRLPPLDPATVRKPPAPSPQAVIDPATGLPAAPFPARRGRAAPGKPGPAAPGG